MTVKNRQRKQKPQGAAFDAFVDGGEAAPEPPTAPATGRQAAPRGSQDQEAPAWVQRANAEKKTEAQPLRYNRQQARLLAHAKAVEGRDFSKILADLIWPMLEEKYGKEVPLDED